MLAAEHENSTNTMFLFLITISLAIMGEGLKALSVIFLNHDILFYGVQILSISSFTLSIIIALPKALRITAKAYKAISYTITKFVNKLKYNRRIKKDKRHK